MDASCGYARRILYCANSNIPALRLQQSSKTLNSLIRIKVKGLRESRKPNSTNSLTENGQEEADDWKRG